MTEGSSCDASRAALQSIICADCGERGHVAINCPRNRGFSLATVEETIEQRLEDLRGDLKVLAADLLRHDDIECVQYATAAILAVGRLVEELHTQGIAQEIWGLQDVRSVATAACPPGVVRHAED